MDTFEQYFEENRWAPWLVGAASMMSPGGVEAKNEPTTQRVAPAEAFDKNQFVKDWGTWYQTSRDPVKMKRAKAVVNGRTTAQVPPEAMRAIDIAASIFEGDHGATRDEIKQYLIYTGFVESEYKTKVQTGGGPARSYWQVEPSTAYSLVHNSYQYLGTNFRKQFPDRMSKSGKPVTALQKLQSLDMKQWSIALEKYDNLAAIIAAHKWISTKWKQQSLK